MGNHETVIINNYNIQLYIISQYKRVRKSNPLTLYPLYYYLSKTNTNFIKRKQDKKIQVSQMKWHRHNKSHD
jgi:hypothetical protein